MQYVTDIYLSKEHIWITFYINFPKKDIDTTSQKTHYYFFFFFLLSSQLNEGHIPNHIFHEGTHFSITEPVSGENNAILLPELYLCGY